MFHRGLRWLARLVREFRRKTSKSVGYRRLCLEQLEDRITPSAGALDTTFSFDGLVTTAIGAANDTAASMAIDGNGRIVVAGTSWNGSNNDFALARYNADGSLDLTFGTNGKVTRNIGVGNDIAYSVAIDGNGKIVVAGSYYNGSNNDFALVRYDANGSLDNAFGAAGSWVTSFGTGDDVAQSVAIDGNGKIVVVGYSSNGNNYDFALARYNANGSPDATFSGDGKVTTDFGHDERVKSVAIDGNGMIVVAGYSINGTNVDFALARYSADGILAGTLDNTFDFDGKLTTDFGTNFDFAYSVAIDGNGKIVVAGSSVNGTNIFEGVFALARYNLDGSLDSTFGTNGKVTTAIGTFNDAAQSVAIDGNGKVVVAGYSSNGSNVDFALAQYNNSGILDTTFDGDGKLTTAIGGAEDAATSVAIDGNGKIVVAGYSVNGGNYDFALARYNGDGSLNSGKPDTSFDTDGKLTTPIGAANDYANSVAIDGFGRAVVAGYSFNGSNNDFGLARYNLAGGLDQTFSSDGKLTTDFGTSDDTATSVAIDGNGKIVVAGYSFNGSNYAFALARYNLDGTPDTTFDGDGKLTTAIGRAYSMAIDGNGRIVVVGNSLQSDGTSNFVLVRYRADGTSDLTLIDVSDSAEARSVAIDGNGNIVVAGSSSNGGTYDFALTRYNADGLDSTFGTNGRVTTDFSASDDKISSMAIDGNGKIVVAGYSMNGSDSNFALARYNADGSLDTTFSADGKVTTAIGLSADLASSVAIDGNGKIVAAGNSFNGSGNYDFALARYNTTGSLDITFSNDGKLTTAIGAGSDLANSVAIDGNGKIVVAGYAYNGSNSDFALARYGDTAPEFPAVFNPRTGEHGSTPSNIALNVSDADPGDSITAAVTLHDPLYDVKSLYGLNAADAYFNYRGANEKYLFSTNGSNPAGGGVYVLMPTNKLYAWAGSLPATLAQTPVVDFTSSTYATVDVWANPALLYTNTGVPIVIVNNALNDLKVKYGLDSAAGYLNVRGGNEWYLHSSNGNNAANGGWYLLLPNNTLVAWNGSISNYSLVADLSSYGNIYGNPALLTAAAPTTEVGVTASVTSPIATFPGGTLTITPTAWFERTVLVTVSITDGFIPVAQTFTYRVINAAPSISVINDPTIAHPTASYSFNVGSFVTDLFDSSTKTYSVSVSGSSSSAALADLNAQYGLFSADQYFNYRGANEKYLFSSNGSSNVGNASAYLLMPDNKLYAWDGNSIATMTAGGTSSPYFVADFSTAAYGSQNVYATPALLYNAKKAATPPTVNLNSGPAYDVRMKYGLNSADLYYNYYGQYEKWFLSGNGSNAANGGAYAMLPDGKLYAWDGISILSTIAQTPVADLGTVVAYSDTRLLYQAQPVVINDTTFRAREQFGLYTRDQYANYYGQNEKWLVSGNGSNAAHGGAYALLANGNLYAWNGVSILSTIAQTPVATLGTAVYNTPASLYSGTGMALGVTGSVSAGGVLTLTRDAGFAGTVLVKVTASDGAEKATQSFLFTVTNNAPVLPVINNVTASVGSTGTSFAVGATDAVGETLVYRATVSNNPLYLLKTQLGLNGAEYATNYYGANEKWFVSSTNMYYVLTTANKLYAWNGVSYASTILRPPVADFTTNYYGNTNVYATTSLLYNASNSDLSSITAGFTGGTLNLTWSSGFAGRFLVTVFVSDGESEVQRTFLVTVS